MTDMQRYITELLKGNVPMEEPLFNLDDDFRAVDRQSYREYLPLLCRFIETEKEPFKQAIGRFLLERIIPDNPDLPTAQCLLKGLANPDKISRNLLLSHITVLKLPEGTDLEPLKEGVRKGDLIERKRTLEAFRAAPGGEGEMFLLEVLRRTHSLWDIEIIAETLADIGGIFSLPVLMARLEKETPHINRVIYGALEKIADRLDMPQDIKSQFADPRLLAGNLAGQQRKLCRFYEHDRHDVR